MPPGSENLPRVSFIMPTLNVEALLDNVLGSIIRQTYPRDRYEILLADARSTDGTSTIAQKYGATVIDCNGIDYEESKRMALARANGEYIVFVDADNEITHTDYIELAVRALGANPQALGVEGYYLPSPKMSSLCAYLTHRLHISDPLSWLLSTAPELVARAGEVERWCLPGDSMAYPLGANGFVFRRADLEAVNAKKFFQDSILPIYLMRAGKREWLRIHGRGVYHYYVRTLGEFIRKRRRTAVQYLRMQRATPVNWVKEKPPMPIWLAGLYCVTFLGPLWHTFQGLIRDRDWRWLWHPVACPASFVGAAWGFWTYWRRGHRDNLISSLKPHQTINGGS